MTRAQRAPSGPPARAVLCPSAAAALPDWVTRAVAASGISASTVPSLADVVTEVRRGRPALVVVDGRGAATAGAVDTLRALKANAVMAVVPCVAIADSPGEAVVELLGAGADEALTADHPADEAVARVTAALRRSARDLSAQPTTRLPASTAIEREIERRIVSGEPFAACYADLDHFKEFNDRYGYHEGDRVIRMVARILHDAAIGTAGSDAFVGHVGGDDFMLVLPLDHAVSVCELALDVFDTLVPYQYSDADRRAGYYFGKDRRGQLHRVPLMTLSIGVATTERRAFRSAAEVSRLASEMKSFAKAQPGSVFAVDRRGEQDLQAAPGHPPTPHAATVSHPSGS